MIANYPDWPQKGVIFKNLSPILAEPDTFSALIDLMIKKTSSVDFE